MNAEDEDERAIQELIGGDPTASTKLDFLNRALEPGEKASDAVDYEDIEDDDLAEEEVDEDAGMPDIGDEWQTGGQVGGVGDLDGIFQEGTIAEADAAGTAGTADGELDDLFGDSSITYTGAANGTNGTQTTVSPLDSSFNDEHVQPLASTTSVPPPLHTHHQPTISGVSPGDEAIPSASSESERLMALNFDAVPAPPENREEALATIWPKFKKDQILNFMELIPQKKAQYVGKTPLRPPKPVLPTKLTLEIARDQERDFLSNDRSVHADEGGECKRIITISESDTGSKSDDGLLELDPDDDTEPIGGVSWNDFKLICDDWEGKLERDAQRLEVEELEAVLAAPPTQSTTAKRTVGAGAADDLFGDDEMWTKEPETPKPKRQKKDPSDPKTILAMNFTPAPSFDDFERQTAQLAKKVVLDLNDPMLLVDIHEPTGPNRNQRLGGNFKRGIGGKSNKELLARYNISNDEAYELLKENHQSKVRNTLGNLTVEHSMPATRLQYPYYKVKLATREARSFHRPALNFRPNEHVRFSRPGTIKRKHLKGRDTKDIFHATKDLSLGDNSNLLLLEFSEEYPIMMSNFGMGSRLINYYRRKNMEDNARPRLDVGETAVLMPQDKSPFSMFGDVDPGETVPALYNSMFRAPLFKQKPKSTDFLVVRNTTGVDGSNWYMRNVENLFVVGQEFPSVDVPGPHSRKVTTASKNRLKMISYRKMRRERPACVTVDDVTEHFPDTTDMQNRQKMKEFLQYNKDTKAWEMRPGESVPDEDQVRSMIKPEDVCLLESTQVGLRHLQDAGYGRADDDSEDENAKEGQSMEQQLAPWKTTKNFLDATQGKAMLALHGEGDPSGRGEAISFVRTSMKGGYVAEGESAADKMTAKQTKELGGHSYNVAKQQRAYQDAIRRIWDKQKTSLSSTVDQSETEMDDDVGAAADDRFEEGQTARSTAATPSFSGHRGDDETGSQLSKLSTSSQRGRILRITRKVKVRGREEVEEELVRDPRVIREYLKRRRAMDAEAMRLLDLNGPTGDDDKDRVARKRLEEELTRLNRNKERRLARDKQKASLSGYLGDSPHSPGSETVGNIKAGGTQRKCANCGQVGHIKTNKKCRFALSLQQSSHPSVQDDANATT
ncbi:MAG: hypothetical protein M1817_002157 [Caeruleum heppii]|nr:MAG: hypothetical protein M1817_002157 [Caeruleum heppii]